ncbi:MAG TPA: hypothetical protein DCQ93_08630 [Bacteroidetes bacterium]|nr:hypothetical protein [Bacteroidota bacterium]
MDYTLKGGIIYSTFVSGLTLKTDLYLPNGTENRPCLVLVHGGGFFRGSRREEPIKSYATMFAQNGYVVMSIDYRLSFPSANAVQQGVQDTLAAVRWIRSQSIKYKIDDQRIFVAGTSAGGLCACGAAYMDAQDFLQSNLNHSNEGWSNSVAGVANLWGAVLKLSYIEQTESPIISIYGKSDTTVPTDCGNSFGVSCCGGKAINEYCKTIGVRSVEYPFDGKHGMGNKTSAHYAELLQLTFNEMLTFFNSIT